MEKHWFLPKEHTEDYLRVCREASENDEKFANFRREPIYQMIVDNGNQEGAQRLYDYLNENCRIVLGFFNSLIKKENIDYFGDPYLFSVSTENDCIEKTSNTRLRYQKILSEIVTYIIPENEGYYFFRNKKVHEIGGGFGGLCIMFDQLLKPKMYNIYDLPEACRLQSRFIREFNTDCDIMFENNIKNNISEFDLVISVCAYSELDRELQDEYIDKVISKAKYGYFHLNNGVEEQANYLRSRLTDKEIIVRDIFSREPINQSLFMFKPK